MAKYAKAFGADEAYEFDKDLGHDLTDDDTFHSALADIDAGRITSIHLGIPCNTLSVVRFLDDPRWNVLRTSEEIYGKAAGLTPDQLPEKSSAHS